VSESDSDIRTKLAAKGVRSDVIDYVTATPPSTFPNIGLLTTGVMCAGFGVGALLIWPALESIAITNALRHARLEGGILYYQNFGVSLVVALFAWICAAAALVGALPMISSRIAVQTFKDAMFSKALENKPRMAEVAQAAQRKMLERSNEESTATRYVVRATTGWIGVPGGIAVILSGIAVVLAFGDVRSHSLFTRDGYIHQSFFPGQPTVTRDWTDATYVEAGCNHVTGRNASDDPIYIVHFRDGASTRLEDAIPLGASWLDRIELIDAQLVSAGKQFRTWEPSFGRNPLHPECLAANRERLSRHDYQRLLRLLRVNT
jgi:hypothetical protein